MMSNLHQITFGNQLHGREIPRILADFPAVSSWHRRVYRFRSCLILVQCNNGINGVCSFLSWRLGIEIGTNGLFGCKKWGNMMGFHTLHKLVQEVKTCTAKPVSCLQTGSLRCWTIRFWYAQKFRPAKTLGFYPFLFYFYHLSDDQTTPEMTVDTSNLEFRAPMTCLSQWKPSRQAMGARINWSIMVTSF